MSEMFSYNSTTDWFIWEPVETIHVYTNNPRSRPMPQGRDWRRDPHVPRALRGCVPAVPGVPRRPVHRPVSAIQAIVLVCEERLVFDLHNHYMSTRHEGADQLLTNQEYDEMADPMVPLASESDSE